MNVEEYGSDVKPRDLMQEINRVSSWKISDNSISSEKATISKEAVSAIRHEISPIKNKLLNAAIS
jgi:hypothetical protein